MEKVKLTSESNNQNAEIYAAVDIEGDPHTGYWWICNECRYPIKWKDEKCSNCKRRLNWNE